MKSYIVTIWMCLLFVSCKKDKGAVTLPPEEQVSYKIELRLLWSTPNFSLPASNAHFTFFIGMIHSKDSFLWKPGGLATMGLEFVAEVGSNSRLNGEIDAIISGGKALSRFGIPPPAINGGFDTSFVFTIRHSAISFASMIAPSPDWFIGLNNYNLLQNNVWVKELTVPLYLYDAGTEDGDVFGYDNPPTNPQQPVSLLTPAKGSVLANGNMVLAPIGTVRFIKL